MSQAGTSQEGGSAAAKDQNFFINAINARNEEYKRLLAQSTRDSNKAASEKASIANDLRREREELQRLKVLPSACDAL